MSGRPGFGPWLLWEPRGVRVRRLSRDTIVPRGTAILANAPRVSMRQTRHQLIVPGLVVNRSASGRAVDTWSSPRVQHSPRVLVIRVL